MSASANFSPFTCKTFRHLILIGSTKGGSIGCHALARACNTQRLAQENVEYRPRGEHIWSSVGISQNFILVIVGKGSCIRTPHRTHRSKMQRDGSTRLQQSTSTKQFLLKFCTKFPSRNCLICFCHFYSLLKLVSLFFLNFVNIHCIKFRLHLIFLLMGARRIYYNVLGLTRDVFEFPSL